MARGAWGAAIAATSGVTMLLGACPALAVATVNSSAASVTDGASAAASAAAGAATAGAAGALGWTEQLATTDGWAAAAARPTATVTPAWAAAVAAEPLSLEEAKAQASKVAAEVFTPGPVNTQASGGLPTGSWAPSAALSADKAPPATPTTPATPATPSAVNSAYRASGVNASTAAFSARTAQLSDGAFHASAALAPLSTHRRAQTVAATSSSSSDSKGTTSASPAAMAASGGTSGAAPSGSFTAAGASGAGLGLQQFYGLTSFGLSSQLDASVNVGNGNLVIHSRDLAINAPGLSVRIDQFFNLLDVGQSGSGAAGYGGSLSTGQDIGLLINGSGSGSTVTFYGPSGFTAKFTATSSGTYTAPAGINADLVKNSDGTWALTYHSSGEKLTFTSGGYLVKDVDRNGVGLALAYDSSNRLSSITDAAGRVTTLSWNSDNTINVITDPSGRKISYGYQSGGGGVKTITYADGAKVTIDNSRTGSLDGIQTPEGNWTYFDYTTNSKIAKITRFTKPGATSGDAYVTSFSYPDANTTVETDANGNKTTYTIDSAGRVTKVVDALGHSRSVTYTANSDLATAVDAMGAGNETGNQITYSYDDNNNLVAVTLPTGAAAKASYATGSACGSTTTSSGQGGTTWQAKCSTDAAGNTKSFTYDGSGNVLAVKDTSPTDSGKLGTGATPIKRTYQAASGGSASAGTSCGAKTGQVCTSTDGNGNKTTYSYDSSGNLTKVTPPSPLGATSLGYDSLGRVTSMVDGKGIKTTYGYDAYDRRTTTTYNAGTSSAKSTTAGYNKDGNFTYFGDDVAGVSTYGYDALGRQNSMKQPNAAQIDFGYDCVGNITWMFDPYGRVNYSYNAANQLTAMTTPVGSGSSAGTETTTFTYDNNGNETSRTFPNGMVTTTTRDGSGRATELRSVNGSTVIADYKYSYTTSGGSGASADRALIQTRTDLVGIGAAANSTITYTYDGLNRLKNAQQKNSSGGANGYWGYAYDKAGNRTKANEGKGTTDSYTYNAANEITAKNDDTSAWSSDANGNQTSGAWGSASYDTRSALTSLTPAGGSATGFGYTGFGNTTRLTYGDHKAIAGPVGLQATVDANGSTIAFHYTPDGRRVSAELPDGTSRYYLTDSLGSVIAVTSKTQVTAKYAYSPYGITLTTSGGEAGANPFRYTGAYTDANAGGLYKMGARYYDPVTGRFTQPDPSGRELNDYAYARNCPANFNDPTGRDSVWGTLSDVANGCSEYAGEATEATEGIEDAVDAVSDDELGGIVYVGSAFFGCGAGAIIGGIDSLDD